MSEPYIHLVNISAPPIKPGRIGWLVGVQIQFSIVEKRLVINSDMEYYANAANLLAEEFLLNFGRMFGIPLKSSGCMYDI